MNTILEHRPLFEEHDGIQTYVYRSWVIPGAKHCVSRVDEEPWEVAPADMVADLDLTVDEARAFRRELDDLIEAAEILNERGPCPRGYSWCDPQRCQGDWHGCDAYIGDTRVLLFVDENGPGLHHEPEPLDLYLDNVDQIDQQHLFAESLRDLLRAFAEEVDA